MKLFIVITALAASIAGCATNGAPTADAQTGPGDLVYRTGSNIPIRNTTPLTPEEKQKQTEESQRSMQQLQRTGAGTPKP